MINNMGKKSHLSGRVRSKSNIPLLITALCLFIGGSVFFLLGQSGNNTQKVFSETNYTGSPTYYCLGTNCGDSAKPALPITQTVPTNIIRPNQNSKSLAPTLPPCPATQIIQAPPEHKKIPDNIFKTLWDSLLNLLTQLLQLLQGQGGTTPPVPTSMPMPTTASTQMPMPTTVPSDMPMPTMVPPTIPMPSENPSPTDIPCDPNPPQTPTDTPVPTDMPIMTIVPSAAQPVIPSFTPAPSAVPTPITGAGQTISPTPQDMGNYSGYAYSIANPAANDTVQLTWTNNEANCTGKGLLSPWVGMGDLPMSEKNLAQLGTDLECNGGSASYPVWTERLPDSTVYHSTYDVQEGDQITASVTFQGNGTFATTISDQQQGWTLTLPMKYSSSYTAQGAEAIFEEVGGNGVPQFTPFTFTNFIFANGSTTNLQPVSTASDVLRFDMKHAQTSPLAGSTFTMTYR